jgi:hypothetical protein
VKEKLVKSLAVKTYISLCTTHISIQHLHHEYRIICVICTFIVSIVLAIPIGIIAQSFTGNKTPSRPGMHPIEIYFSK